MRYLINFNVLTEQYSKSKDTIGLHVSAQIALGYVSVEVLHSNYFTCILTLNSNFVLHYL